MSLIECKNITKRFGKKVALDNVSFEIPEGKIMGLLGPNGAGKTTLIRIINRIIMADEGEILFKGKPIRQKDVEKIGYLPEERGLYRKMKVGEQVMYLAELKGMNTYEARQEFKYWFEKFGIESWWNKKVQELSKGMAQKIQFISTVVHKPSLMILDEPFSGFDPVNADLIRKEILRLKAEGATIVLSTHNMASVEELCDNIALINSSKLIVSGELDSVLRKYGSNNLELLYSLSDDNKSDCNSNFSLNGVEGLFSVVSESRTPEGKLAVLEMSENVSSNDVLVALLKQNINIRSFKELIPTMNDVFIKLVTEETKK